MSNANGIVETWSPIAYGLNSSIGLEGAPPVNVMTFPNSTLFHVDRVAISVTWTSSRDGAASIVLYGHRDDLRRAVPRTVVYLPQLTEVPDWLESIILRAFPAGIEVSWR